ncbi:hypothetical protein C8Q78DRAFT_1093558 [Trametes maxima]|nr:hypothetical protein C8Q78DRAFT_1093558 [Trametes maxima]
MPADRLKLTNRGNEGQTCEETATLLSLVAALTLEDVNEIRNQRTDEVQDGALRDEDLALRLFAEEAEALDTFARDMLFAQSLDRALESDTILLREFAQAEEGARRDREFAITLAGGRPPPREAVPGPPVVLRAAVPQVTDKHDAQCRHIVFIFYHRPWQEDTVCVPLPYQIETTLMVVRPRRAATCVICRDDIEGHVVRAPCGDLYDMECLVQLFRAATVDESLFPPSCCRQPFKLEDVCRYLDSNLRKLIEKKALEFGTKNRVYCYKPTCSSFLGAATPRATRVLCTTCWAYTCGHCKAAAHDLSFMCTNAEDAAVVALAEESGWKRCPGCGHLVELSIGCYHMTCRCRHEFCYLCTARWKTCSCTQWDEDRLITAARDRVQRQGVRAPARGGNVEEFRQRVAREAERLRVDHECAHRWVYVSNPGRCDGCGHYLRLFLFNCRWCALWACARCKHNRVL